ncbi:GNAT family N-acetyltransferase [Anaerocolumna sedimenticola]|uniref:GNAT family N-acetyltransferase n=1 Tax=Anaerocolumna sedimenticola TaxID=2696063 RepID=A0A6P1TNM3_9FIRM|nr:GNAT family protein [Anaerocolumna sedimenticola]QHQ62063.1 GNAT family N-acetyltransferase [Anaerocolumna sedimenticola]
MKVLETDRLLLRNWEISDLEDFYEYAKSPNIGPMAGWKPHQSLDESQKILNSFIEEEEVWAVVYKSNRKVIGSIGLHNDRKRNAENIRMIGYVLSENYWGLGLIPEAVREVVRYSFEELDLVLISIYHYPFNYQSKRVIEKCGFQYEGILRMGSQIYNGQVYDDVCYSIKKEEWLLGTVN